MFSYTIIRSRRKTVAIHITKDATVEVRAPLKMLKSDIDKFVMSKERWITSHLTKREQLNNEKSAFTLNYGDMVVLCGRTYPIIAKGKKLTGFDGECFYLPPGLSPGNIKPAVMQTYKAIALRLLTDKAAAYAKRMDVIPSAVKVNDARSRWGSCSGKNSINFSWRLIMAEESVIDYVVVHELAHIKEHNHSPRFWAIVAKVLPDYKQRRLQLKALQDRLSREDWEV